MSRRDNADNGRPKALMAASVASMIDQFNMPNIQLLQDMGYEVHAACNFEQGNTCDAARIRSFRHTLKAQGVLWHQWDCPRRPSAACQCVRAYMQLWALTGRYRYDLIHCHSPIGGALARVVAHVRKIPVIYTAHGFHFYQGAPVINWLVYYPVEKLLAYWTDMLITMNREDYAFAKRNLAAKKIWRIPGVGVDTRRFAGMGAERENVRRAFRKKYGIPQDAAVLLSVGELSERKNHKVILNALAVLGRKDIYYIICGQGGRREWLARYAKSLCLERRIYITGYMEHVDAAYASADIFVFPSIQEGLPVAVLEAMAAGLPVIASRIRGNVDLIDGHGGFLIDAGDAAGYAKAIAQVMEWKEQEPERLLKMCAYNRRKVLQYDIEKMNQYMGCIYRWKEEKHVKD